MCSPLLVHILYKVVTIDKEIEQDEIPQITEKFTQGYHDNPRSYGLVMTLTDLDKSRLK